MKEKTHPASNNVCFVDVSTNRKYLTRSVMKSEKKETIEGVEYFVILRDVTSDSHPAYTGEKRYVDTAGRVEKFQRKFGRREGVKKPEAKAAPEAPATTAPVEPAAPAAPEATEAPEATKTPEATETK